MYTLKPTGEEGGLLKNCTASEEGRAAKISSFQALSFNIFIFQYLHPPPSPPNLDNMFELLEVQTLFSDFRRSQALNT